LFHVRQIFFPSPRTSSSQLVDTLSPPIRRMPVFWFRAGALQRIFPLFFQDEPWESFAPSSREGVQNQLLSLPISVFFLNLIHWLFRNHILSSFFAFQIFAFPVVIGGDPPPPSPTFPPNAFTSHPAPTPFLRGRAAFFRRHIFFFPFFFCPFRQLFS